MIDPETAKLYDYNMAMNMKKYSSNDLTCPTCERAVKVKQQWHYNRTWLYIHCKCGRHRKSEQRWRGDSMDGLKEKLIEKWREE